jgi:hypothetical protein
MSGKIIRTKWFHLTEKDFNELLRLSRSYYRESVRCEDSKAYVAGCTVAGASLEAILMVMVHIYGDEVEAARLVPIMKEKSKPLLKWTFAELLRAARGMNWLPAGLQIDAEWNARRAKIGDYTEVLRKIRNLIHPARYLQDHSPSRITRRYLEQSIEILEVANKFLEAKVHESLRKDIGIAD